MRRGTPAKDIEDIMSKVWWGAIPGAISSTAPGQG